MAPILDSYSESSYENAHETLSLALGESDDVPSSAFIHGYDHDMIEHGDICTYISPTTIYDIECISYERMSVTTTSPTLESIQEGVSVMRSNPRSSPWTHLHLERHHLDE